jgi:branched-chain amino acid transport system permease protein
MALQILINGVISGSLLALVALGFHIIFSVTKIFHMAHGGVYVAGVYFFYWLNQSAGLVASVVMTLLFAVFLGLFTEWAFYKPLMKKTNNENIALITSLGIYIIIINIIALLFGNDAKILYNSVYESLTFGNVIITRPQLWQILFAVPLIILFLLFMKCTSYGLKVRAVSDNPELAKVIGIKTQRVRYLVFGLGSLIAVAAGLLEAFDFGIEPEAGMSITLTAIVVVVLAGQHNFYSILATSMLISILNNITEWFLSSQWEEGLTYLILIIVLLFRTEGILSYKLRIEEK